jgi:hypothetical protein
MTLARLLARHLPKRITSFLKQIGFAAWDKVALYVPQFCDKLSHDDGGFGLRTKVFDGQQPAATPVLIEQEAFFELR